MQEREIKGITTELACQAEFIKRGFNVSVPISPYYKYDFLADINNTIIRVQVKYSKKTKTGLQFETKSCHLSASGNIINTYSKDDVDYFCTYFEDNCYLVPIELIEHRGSITLSLSNTWKNAHHYLDASIYLIDNQIKKMCNHNEYIEQSRYVIQQLTKDGILVAEYNDMSECDLYMANKARMSHISACISGKQKSAYGYIWKRSEKARIAAG